MSYCWLAIWSRKVKLVLWSNQIAQYTTMSLRMITRDFGTLVTMLQKEHTKFWVLYNNILRIPDSYDAKIEKSLDILACNSAKNHITELQARTSRDCRFLLFLHHNYQVSLRIVDIQGARPPWYVLLDYFTTRPYMYIKYLNVLVFFTKWPEMVKVHEVC